MGRARGRARGVLGSGEHGDKRMGARRRWIARREECATIDARFAGSRSMLPLCCLPVGPPGHESTSARDPARSATARVARHKRKRGGSWPSTSPTRKRRPWPRSAGAMYFEKTTKCRGRAPRENPRLAGRKPSRLAPPFATHESAEQRQNTPGQVSDSQSRARTVVKTCSTCLLSAAVLCRWASRPTAAPPQLWGRRAAANGLLTRGTRADGGAARAREARPGPELRPGQ